MWTGGGIGELEVALDDSGILAWRQGIQMCGAMGVGWRLPTITDLVLLYARGFRALNAYYLTQTADLYSVDNQSDWRVYVFNASSGVISHGQDISAYRVRCVKGH